MTEHRWRGYSHQELYQKLNSGPGAQASHASMERWAGVSAALSEITEDLTAGIAKSGAVWQGAAGDQARTATSPLAMWAADAQSGADVMRVSAEMQADFVSRARADMPPPVPVTAEKPSGLVTLVAHVFGAQTDYELQESQQSAAEQRAFEVMASYESNTTANTSTLGQFEPPPQVVVDATPTAVRAGGAAVVGAVAAIGFVPGGGVVGGPTGRTGAAGRRVEPIANRPDGEEPRPTSSNQPSSGRAPGSSPERVGGAARGATTTSSARGATAGSSTASASPASPAEPAGGAGGSGGEPVVPGQRRGGQRNRDHTATSSASGAFAPPPTGAHPTGGAPADGVLGAAGSVAEQDVTHRRTTGQGGGSGFDPFGTLGVRADDEEDAVHASADFLVETEDVYGEHRVSPPVIGESTTAP